ncbi:MAG: alpha/beta hydrolase [Rhizobiales bacterium]|nr:alpha/beta hydrolase [Hyphomicrobiales bacterium]
MAERRIAFPLVFLLLVAFVPTAAAAQTGSAQGMVQAAAGELWLIPSPQPGISMRATFFRPPGKGPYPLVLINHGSVEDADQRALAGMPSFPALTAWFTARGYAVLVPQRPGHGKTGGKYAESEGACASPDFVRAGEAAADSIAAAIAFMVRQPFIKPTGIVVVGNSAGGWGAMALAGRNPRGVVAIIGFAPGRGGRQHGLANNNCAPGRLVEAAARFGAKARIRTLWLYAANDTYFPPKLSGRLAAAFARSGGKAEYHLLPPVGREGHGLIQAPSAIWGPAVEQFLAGR